MIIEMRTYRLKIGSVREVETRFAKALTERIKFSRLAAFWHTEIGPLHQIMHVWPYESMGERERIRAAAGKAEGWPPPIQEFLLEQKSEIFVPAPFSPPLEERNVGPLFEIRSYTCQAGSIPTIIQRWGERIEGRVKLSPLVGCWYSEVGALNTWIHIWGYRDFAERERVREESMRGGNWPPPTQGLMLKQENCIALASSFSPIR